MPADVMPMASEEAEIKMKYTRYSGLPKDRPLFIVGVNIITMLEKGGG